MPLQDHFHPPLSNRRHWHSFHNAWATYLASGLNRLLPEGYFAEANVQFGIEIDVATLQEPETNGVGPPSRESPWAPPAPVQTLPFALGTDIVEIQVFHDEGGPTLAGAVELVSPANKDRPASRDAFVSKCVTYLHQGVGLAMVDVVTERTANLHNELLRRMTASGARLLESDLYAAAYHPVERSDQGNLDIWQEALALGRPLPTLPFWLRGGLCYPLDLEAAYERTREEQRIPGNGT